MDENKECLKRSRDDESSDDVSNLKKRKVDNAASSSLKSETSNEVDSEGIFSLSDDVLLILLSYLNSTDLFHLSRCDPRLFDICGDKSLWAKVNANCDGSCPSHNEQALFFHPATTHLRFVKTISNDNVTVDTCFKDDFFHTLSNYAPNLKSLVIENHILCSPAFTLENLPATITELRLPRVELLHSDQEKKSNLFQNINKMLPNLEIVDASYCQWFNPHALLALGKCEHLKELRIAGCRNLKDFIPYASIAAIIGFQQLHTLDLRYTGIVDREIACFNKTKSLKHIFLEKPDDIEDLTSDESVTDVCTTSFCMRSCETNHSPNIVFITRIPQDGGTFTDYTLETLVVRNYPGITDITLKHAQKCLKSLKYLDVTGCSCTPQQASIFKQNRPEVELIYDGVALEL